jgi:hypothetical protein
MILSTFALAVPGSGYICTCRKKLSIHAYIIPQRK